MRAHLILATSIVLAFGASTLPSMAKGPDRRRSTNQVSPARQIESNHPHHHHPVPEYGPTDVRSYAGGDNNLDDPEQNAALTPLLRLVPADYADGVSSLAGATRPSARDVSNRVNEQLESIPNEFGTSDFLWQWGQFVDHDIDLTDGTDPPEPAPISVPLGDPYFDPLATGTASIPLNRSIYESSYETDRSNPRQQLNMVSGWLDGSNIYGSDEARARALRTLDGTGHLTTSPGDLLTDDDGSESNATGGSSQTMFLSGDVRANEQLGLTALHTLFMREHNRLADEIRAREPRLDGETIYQRARQLVGAMIEAITFQEFLPALLGADALLPYHGYDPNVDARIRNEFSTAVYRFGHSALPPMLLRLDKNLHEIPEGPIALRDAFFSPDRIRDEGGIEPLLRGLASQVHQRIDVYVIDDVRNFLFGPPGAGGFDLAALNVQRGRDHGLPSYNDMREAYGFARAVDFADVSSDPEVQARLADAYATVDDIDLWVGGLAEDAFGSSQVGPLVYAMLVDQFSALRDGDRFWYERALDRRDLDAVRHTRLSDVIRRNTSIGHEIPDDVFHVAACGDPTRPHRGHGSGHDRAPRR